MANLNGGTHRPVIKRPDWWNAFQQAPDWWKDVQFSLPQITSYKDGFDFVGSTVFKDPDGRKLVKAYATLLDFTPLAEPEKIESMLGCANAFSRIEDHHRAIENAWAITEQFPGDGYWCRRALQFIASEFDKNGEPSHAQEIRGLLTSYTE